MIIRQCFTGLLFYFYNFTAYKLAAFEFRLSGLSISESKSQFRFARQKISENLSWLGLYGTEEPQDYN